jgi:hypothetical protein
VGVKGGLRFGGGIALLASLALCAPAAATTFCVPTFHAACPNNGTNVALANIETAMQTSSSDGNADVISIDNLSVSNPNTITPSGSDGLTIQGTGPASEITTTSVANEFVLNLASDARSVTVQDLTIAVPASMPADQGAATQISGDTLENVDIVSRNPGAIGSSGITTWIGGGTFRGGEIRPEGAGALNSAIASGSPATGAMLVERATIDSALSALSLSTPAATLAVRRTEVANPLQVGIAAAAGSTAVENTVITTSGHFPLVAIANSANNATLTADHLTIVNTGFSNLAGLDVSVIGSSAGDANATLTNSVMRGYDLAYQRQVANLATGEANLAIRHSNVPAAGASDPGDAGTLDIAVGNITADPLFASATDFHLLAGSPSIDAGDPAAGGLAVDFDGAPRPADGNADGIARRDQGAYELQPPAPPPPPPTPTPADTTAPETTISAGPGKRLDHGKARFRFESSEAGSSFECALDRKAFKPCGSPRTFKRLKHGRHRFRVRAIDAAGNVDASPARKRFSVPRR